MKTLVFILVILNSICLAQTINVMGYEQQTTMDCIEDWLETNPSDYEGVYTFIHFGTTNYTFYYKNDTAFIEDHFQSNMANEKSTISDITVDKNKLYALEYGWREFKARFVNLKCDVNSEILKGFHGLLVNEELLYIMQGD